MQQQFDREPEPAFEPRREPRAEARCRFEDVFEKLSDIFFTELWTIYIILKNI
jgi:hypothetical protein